MCSLRSVYPTVESSGEGNTRFRHNISPDDGHKIQGNKTANREWQDYSIVWSWTDSLDAESPGADALEVSGRGRATGNGEFVRNLQVGDVVTIWGLARFPGWVNHIEKVGIKVYWAI
jgi:hypothetical protein